MKWPFGIGPVPRPLGVLFAGVGAGLTILALLMLHDATQLAWLIPSFGASCALVFGVPDSPFANPVSVIGGHLVSSSVGLAGTQGISRALPAATASVACTAAYALFSYAFTDAGGKASVDAPTLAQPLIWMSSGGVTAARASAPSRSPTVPRYCHEVRMRACSGAGWKATGAGAGAGAGAGPATGGSAGATRLWMKAARFVLASAVSELRNRFIEPTLR